ncbi:MAG TPA: hypothetical protein VFA12_20015 [Stellaceae bacterium]|nr:hypothetical protein [Stellaceae bacterium]
MTRTPAAATVADVPPPSLHGFSLDHLAPFCAEKSFPRDANPEFRTFYVGCDDVHGILAHLLSRARQSLVMNMFGYADEALNDLVMRLVMDPSVLVMVTLDKSQAGGVHERQLLEADRKQALAEFDTHFAIGQSATHQISHTKGGVIDGVVGWEGSTNWSASGEGTFVLDGRPGGPRYRAQNNTLTVYTNPYELRRATIRLTREHLVAKGQHQKPAPRRRQSAPLAR